VDGATGSDEVDRLVVNRRVLIRYRVMAYTTAVLLIILVFVAVPLQFAGGVPIVA